MTQPESDSHENAVEPGDSKLDRSLAEMAKDNPYATSGELERDGAEDPRRGNRLLAIGAWLIILLLATFIFVANMTQDPEVEAGQAKAELMQVNLQLKMLVGMSNSMPQPPEGNALEGLNTGPLDQRYCYVVARCEFEDANVALTDLNSLEDLIDSEGFEPDERQLRLGVLLRILLEDYQQQAWQAPSLTQDDRQFLVDELGYAGRLSLHPSGAGASPERDDLVAQGQLVFVLVMIGFGVGLLTGIAGFVCAGILGAMMLGGKLRWHFDAAAADKINGRIYIETFAVWFVLFLLVSVPLALLAPSLGAAGQSVAALTGFLTTLLALAWPLARGISWREMCNDLGLRLGNPIKEVALGVFAYLANLPVMFAGFFLFVLLLATSTAFGPERSELESVSDASHPIVGEIASGNVFVIVTVFLTACVAAPLVEETVFRGLMYRHLRESTVYLGRIPSVACSVLLNSFLFAAIHPQGWTAIPVLMSLAVGFSWAREWRDSLVASITMHAVNNSAITVLMILLFL